METDSMPLFDNESRILQIEKEKAEIFQYMKNPLICQLLQKTLPRDFHGVQMQSKGTPCRWKKRLR